MRPLRIGIACFPTVGGSGIVATELGLELGRLGHSVHFVSSDVPWRFDPQVANVRFHKVEALDYPLFPKAPDALAGAAKLLAVAESERLDVLHTHYGLPHAVAGYLAVAALGPKAPRLVVTLHGTELTILRAQPDFAPLLRLALRHADAVTVPSQFLQREVGAALGLAAPIEVIPNFVDTEHYRPETQPRRRPIIVHSSNFRAVKRVGDVVRVFAEVRSRRAAELLLIGDGPERAQAQALVDSLGLASSVQFLGERRDFAELLRAARVFLLPSELEGFGLAALEALSSGVPVVASNGGALPEVVADAGILANVGDVSAMARAVSQLLDDDALHAELAARARRIALTRFEKTATVRRYEALYDRLVSSSASSQPTPS